MLFSRQRGKGDATSHYAARWLRLAAAGGGRKLALLATAYQCIGRCTRIAGGGLFSGSFCGSFTPPLSLGVCDLANNSAKFKIISSFWLIF